MATPPPAEGPVIPDDQFEAEIPPLDPALNAPLEPIEQFEMPALDPAGELPPPGEPADPELTTPLPPLSGFDVTPLPTTPADEAEPAPVRYSLTVEGLKEVELEGRFRDLSALDDDNGEATNAAAIASHMREDEALAIRLLRSEGYYDAAATVTSEQAADEQGRLRITLTAVPGERYKLGEIVISGPDTIPPGMAREALGLKSGDPIVAANIEGAEANILLRLPEQGYPFTKLGARDVLLDPETFLGDYTLPLDTGPRATFGGFTTEGKLAFDAEHVGVLARFKRGDLYDRRKMDDLREAMVATNLFSSVTTEPVLTGEKAPDGSEYVNIRVVQTAGPARSLTGSAGYSTGEGFRIEGAWEHRNLFPPEGALRFAAILGSREQRLMASFRRSNAGKRDKTFLLTAEAGRRDYPAFEGYTAAVGVRWSRDSTPIWQKKWTWAYGADLIATNENRFESAAQQRLRGTYFIGGLTGQLAYDGSDNLLNPTKGFRLLGRISPEASLKDGLRPYVRGVIEGSYYQPVSDKLVIAGRARFGTIYGIDRDDLAPSRRFYAGGGGSVRGFGYQELGPREEVINDEGKVRYFPIGGRSLTEFALEGRYRFGNYGAVAFIDAGQVTDNQLPGVGDLRYGVGIGGRVYTNFGPLRVDVATPLGRLPGESRISVYVSIGQAF